MRRAIMTGLMLAAAMPAGAVPVAVELVPGAEDITWFEHPENAAYVFGPEDGTLDVGIRRTALVDD